MKYTHIAIDGPAGAGKSTIAKIVADELNFTYIDTGAMYRAITLKALKLGIDISKEENYVFLENTSIDFYDNKIFLDGVDVSKEIRRPIIDKNVSEVSAFGYVRNRLVKFQREIASHSNVVMDGRDIGSVVLPNADLKVFLTAKVETRAQRRYLELIEELKSKTTIEDLINEIRRRDDYDTNRKISPLKKASDAIEIDTSDMNIEEVSKKIIYLFINKGVH